jgi:hypothetical protein
MIYRQIDESSGREDLRISLYDEHGGILFDGYADMLVTNHRGPLELRLNFGESRCQEYFAVLRAGEDCLLLQTPQGLALGRTPLKPLILSWSAMRELWQRLGYDVNELAAVPGATADDWIEAWISGSPVQPDPSLPLSTRLRVLINDVLAENPEGNPSVKSWLEAAAESTLEVHHPVLRNDGVIPMFSAYLNRPVDVAEWQALGGNGRDLLTIGADWLIRASHLSRDR